MVGFSTDCGGKTHPLYTVHRSLPPVAARTGSPVCAKGIVGPDLG